MTPSISFVSAGPGTQTFVMRGVSDGSNPNYANSATTAFLVDDMSMNYEGTTPDLHLYDIERIEVLNGPQGTTFGAGAMSGALRFITNKPDPTAFSAGIDVDGGKIDGGTHNATLEAFVNLPIIADWTALRISAFSDYHGGFINNVNTSRTWVNGVTSNNSQWAGNDYNVEKVTGARIALGQVIAEGWKASLTYSYQRQLTHGAWDQDPTIGGAVDNNGNLVNGPVRSFGTHNVNRFGPEFKRYYAKTLDLHLDGDVGIGDLVYASTYWAQDDKWVNEYSEYMQYVNTGAPRDLTAVNRQAFTCLTDPTYSTLLTGTTQPFSGCSAPTQYYNYDQSIDRWSNELRLQSKAGGRFHWLIGTYWEKTRDISNDYYAMPGLQTARLAILQPVLRSDLDTPKPDDWYSYVERQDYLQTTEFANITFDITPDCTSKPARCIFTRISTPRSRRLSGTRRTLPGLRRIGQMEQQGGRELQGVGWSAGVCRCRTGFRDGGVNGGFQQLYRRRRAAEVQPDTLTNYEIGWKATLLDKHLVWDSALYYMPWKDLQTLVFDPGICLVELQCQRRRCPGLWHGIQHQIPGELLPQLELSRATTIRAS